MWEEFFQSDAVILLRGKSTSDWNLQMEMFVSVPVQTLWGMNSVSATSWLCTTRCDPCLRL